MTDILKVGQCKYNTSVIRIREIGMIKTLTLRFSDSSFDQKTTATAIEWASIFCFTLWITDVYYSTLAVLTFLLLERKKLRYPE